MVRPTILTPELLRRADEMQRRGITYPQIAEQFASEGAVVKAATLRVQVSKFRKGQLHGSGPPPPTPAPAPPPAPAPRAPRQRSPARKSELATLKEQVNQLQQQVQDLTQTEPTAKPYYFGHYKSTAPELIIEALGEDELNYDQIGEATGLRTSQMRNSARRLLQDGIISKSTRLEWRGQRKFHIPYFKIIGEAPLRRKPGRTRMLEILADGQEHTRLQLAEVTESTNDAIRNHLNNLVAAGKVEKTIRRVAERNTNIAFYRLIA